MQNTEKFRGQTDAIILFIVSTGSRHTDEIKEIIDNTFTGVKIGTLYSIITRLKNQNLLKEFRASSFDGSRRKYYSLTTKGAKTFNENYSTLFEGIELPQPEINFVDKSEAFNKAKKHEVETNKTTNPLNESEATIKNEEPIITESSETTNESATSYKDLIENTSCEDFSNIDFSSLSETEEQCVNIESPTETTTLNNVYNSENEYQENEKINNDTEMVPYTNEINEPNYSFGNDSTINPTFDYTSTLNKLYPKQILTPETEEEPETLDEVKKANYASSSNWGEIYDLAEKEGINIRTSSDTNRYQGSKIFITRLLLTSTFITFLLAIVEYLLLNALITAVFFDKTLFVRILVIFGIPVITTLTALLITPSAKVKNLPRFVNMIEIALIITISTIIITFAISAIVGINYTYLPDVFNMLVIPTVLVINVPIFTIITYLLSKLEAFETL